MPASAPVYLTATLWSLFRKSSPAAAYYLSSAVEMKIPLREKALVPTDLYFALPQGIYAHIVPISDLSWKHSIGVGAGVIDADFRGPIGVVLFNHYDADFEVKLGDRIAELIIQEIIPPEVKKSEIVEPIAKILKLSKNAKRLSKNVGFPLRGSSGYYLSRLDAVVTSLAEYWYNTNYHSATHITPYEVVYGQPPPLHIPYMAKDSKVDLVDRTLSAREKTTAMLKFNLDKAQNRMKVQEDKNRTEREFSVGDWVYLKLQPYRQLTVRNGRQHKLSAKFFGPFPILSKIGQVAYKLQLPQHAKVYPVFHVSQLKKCLTPNVTMGEFPECDAQGLIAAEPFKLLERKMVKQQNRMRVYGLIQWSNGTVEDATWEDLADLSKRFPTFVMDP